MIEFITGNWQRFVAYAIAVAAVLGAVWFHGFTRGEIKLFEYQGEQLKADVKIIEKRGAVTERVVYRYIKAEEKSANAANGIRMETIRYVETNRGYCLDARWGRLHDASSKQEDISSAQSVDDGTVGAPTAAAAIQTVTENYAACHRTANRLDALQQWVREQAAIE